MSIRTIAFLLAAQVAALAQPYVISTVAGGVPPPTPVEALKTSLGYVVSIASDSSGNLYFGSDSSVFKIDAKGILTRVAGNGRTGFSGDGGLAVNAQLAGDGVALDRAGNLYIADGRNGRVRMVAANGVITTVAGSDAARRLGDGGPAIAALLSEPDGVALDASGNLYIADYLDNRVRKVSLGGIITTVAGTGVRGYSGDGGPATNARLGSPISVAVDASGNLYIADSDNSIIRKVTASTGTISTVAGSPTAGKPGDGGPATAAQIGFVNAVVVDAVGNLYIASDTAVRKVSSSTGIITTVAGIADGNLGFNGDNQPATSAQLGGPSGVALDQADNLYIADGGNDRVRKVDVNGIITTIAGNGSENYSGDGGPATSAQLDTPARVAVDRSGNFYISDEGNGKVRKVSRSGVITTIANSYAPTGVAVDSMGNVYFG